MTKIFIHTDGGARGNPGPAAIGVIIKSETGKVLTKLSRKIGISTNNVAEYQAVIKALKWLKENKRNLQFSPNTSFYIYLDSTLVVNQLNGLFKVKNSDLRNFLLSIRQLEQEIGLPIHYSFVTREKNREADFLVNQALDN